MTIVRALCGCTSPLPPTQPRCLKLRPHPATMRTTRYPNQCIVFSACYNPVFPASPRTTPSPELHESNRLVAMLHHHLHKHQLQRLDVSLLAELCV